MRSPSILRAKEATWCAEPCRVLRCLRYDVQFEARSVGNKQDSAESCRVFSTFFVSLFPAIRLTPETRRHCCLAHLKRKKLQPNNFDAKVPRAAQNAFWSMR